MSARAHEILRLQSLFLIALCLTGCQTSAMNHVEHLRNSSRIGDRVCHARALAPFSDRALVQEALIDALRDPAYPVRCEAAKAMELYTGDDIRLWFAGSRALVELLSDKEMGMFCVPLRPGSSLIGLTSFPSVRVTALLTLVNRTGADFGFDQRAWHEYLDNFETERAAEFDRTDTVRSPAQS